MLSALGTIFGVLVGLKLAPLGEAAREIAACFTGAYIGGTLNLVASAKAIELNSSALLSATVAAANLAVTVYLVVLFALPRLRPLAAWLARDQSLADDLPSDPVLDRDDHPLTPLQIMLSLFGSACICAIGFSVEAGLGMAGLGILIVTIITVGLASAFPRQLKRLGHAEIFGFVLLQIFFAAIGASASISAVITVGPAILAFAAIVLLVHMVVSLLGAKLCGFSLLEAAIASDVCAAGSPTTAGMAVNLRRDDFILPALLCGTFGYAIGTFVALALYQLL